MATVVDLSLLPTSGPGLCRPTKKEPKEAFLVFILACVFGAPNTACLGLFCGRRVLGKRKQPRKEIGRGEESEGE